MAIVVSGNIKKCTGCLIEKELDAFSDCKKYGKKHRCKECVSIYNKQTKEARAIRTKKYRDANKDEIKAKKSEYHQLNKERLNEISRNYQAKNKEAVKERGKLYREKNKEKIKASLKNRYEDRFEKRKIYIEKNREHLREKQKEYYYNNRERAIQVRVDNLKKRIAKDPNVRLREILRRRILVALKPKNFIKKSSTIEIIGCSLEDARKHIENQFKQGMSWDNHGFNTWHIDHIIPLAFAKTEDELYKLLHYTNLQPLWAKENLSKNKYLQPCQSLLQAS